MTRKYYDCEENRKEQVSSVLWVGRMESPVVPTAKETFSVVV